MLRSRHTYPIDQTAPSAPMGYDASCGGCPELRIPGVSRRYSAPVEQEPSVDWQPVLYRRCADNREYRGKVARQNLSRTVLIGGVSMIVIAPVAAWFPFVRPT